MQGIGLRAPTRQQFDEIVFSHRIARDECESLDDAQASQSVAAYARRVKLNQVSDRLILTSLPVTSIAAELGFSSESNLRRMFKELTGLTPADYRRQFGRT